MSLKFWPSFMDNSNSLILINCVVCTRSGCFKSILAPETGLMFGFVKVLSKSSFLFSINLPEKEHKIQHHCHEDDKPFSFSSSQSAKNLHIYDPSIHFFSCSFFLKSPNSNACLWTAGESWGPQRQLHNHGDIMQTLPGDSKPKMSCFEVTGAF